MIDTLLSSSEEEDLDSSSTTTMSVAHEKENVSKKPQKKEGATTPSTPVSPIKKLTLKDIQLPDIMDSPNKNYKWDTMDNMDTPRLRQSHFWSLQGEIKSSVTSSKKILQLKPKRASIPTPPEPAPPEPERGSNVSKRKITAAPATNYNRPNITTRQTLEGSGPKVRLTRAALLKLKSQASRKPNNFNFNNNNSSYQQPPRKSKPKAYLRPWQTNMKHPSSSRNNLLSPPNSPKIHQLPLNRPRSLQTYARPHQANVKQSSSNHPTILSPPNSPTINQLPLNTPRSLQTYAQQANMKQPSSSRNNILSPPNTPHQANMKQSSSNHPNIFSPPNTPKIRKLPLTQPRSPRMKTSSQTMHNGKVRLNRSALLKLKQSQELSNKKNTLQDWDNQRLGIPPIKYLEIPNSPTKLNLTDDDMEHPNDLARKKFHQLFGKSKTNNKPKSHKTKTNVYTKN
jgi:hypothetical protein